MERIIRTLIYFFTAVITTSTAVAADQTIYWGDLGGHHGFEGCRTSSGVTNEKIPGFVGDCGDISGKDLSNKDLSGISLRGAILKKTDFKNSLLKKSDLTGADITDANFEGADLSNSVIRKNWKIIGVNFSNANLENVIFRYSDGLGPTISETNFAHANLVGADLKFSRIEKSNFDGAILTGQDLGNVPGTWRTFTVKDSSFKNTNFSKSNLLGAEFVSADLTQANLAGANLESIRMANAKLGGADLSNTNVQGAYFYKSKFNSTTKLPFSIEEAKDKWGMQDEQQ